MAGTEIFDFEGEENNQNKTKDLFPKPLLHLAIEETLKPVQGDIFVGVFYLFKMTKPLLGFPNSHSELDSESL